MVVVLEDVCILFICHCSFTLLVFESFWFVRAVVPFESFWLVERLCIPQEFRLEVFLAAFVYKVALLILLAFLLVVWRFTLVFLRVFLFNLELLSRQFLVALFLCLISCIRLDSTCVNQSGHCHVVSLASFLAFWWCASQGVQAFRGWVWEGGGSWRDFFSFQFFNTLNNTFLEGGGPFFS